MTFTPDQRSGFVRALAVDRGHLGCVVTVGDPGALVLPAPADAAEIIALTTETDPEAVLDRLAACAHAARWCRLHMSDGALPGRVYNQLRSVATIGHLEARGVDVRWPDAVGIAIVVSRDALDQVTVPTFLDLFGPVLREE